MAAAPEHSKVAASHSEAIGRQADPAPCRIGLFYSVITLPYVVGRLYTVSKKCTDFGELYLQGAWTKLVQFCCEASEQFQTQFYTSADAILLY